MPLSFGSINLLECLTELRNILFTRSPVYYKRIKIKNGYMKEMDRKGKREGAQSLQVTSRCTTLPAPPSVHQPVSPLNPVLSGVYGGFIT